MKVQTRKDTEKIQAMQSHGEHIRFQLESIRHEDEDLAKDSTSDTNY